MNLCDKAYFVDLFVRASNAPAIKMYEKIQGSYLLTKPPKTATMPNSLSYFSSSGKFSVQNKPRSFSLVTNASKKDKKEDSHSFAPKLDEVTGFFPESVLLKKKEVEEDGKLLPEFEDEDEKNYTNRLHLKWKLIWMLNYCGVQTENLNPSNIQCTCSYIFSHMGEDLTLWLWPWNMNFML
ncbi:uncharacterized protein LOC131604744 isoform X2 [Vicia villosa]|uniref:uncharacterized protein LOC131604744 isoform X2 n=1 Tax=Vicia villosa TaxID=3911 RepID=UPI00273B4809|nr:uncharacterized protein LOC131604744 isoform X2 [Vicia villosa]